MRRRRGCRALAQQALDARTHPAWTRLKFDELVAQQLSLKAHRKARAARRAPVLTGTGTLTGALLARVPFKLTRAQERVWREIGHDLKRTMPMQRLLQGDVGSGKTIIAALAALQAIESRTAGRVHGADRNSRRAALPQARALALRLAGRDRMAYGRAAGEGAQEGARGASPAARRCSRSARTRCSRTRSLLPRLGLAIVDEQHRFGVAQRLEAPRQGAWARRTS